MKALKIYAFLVFALSFVLIVSSQGEANAQSSVWERVPGEAQSVGIGADGSVFAISPRGEIYQWNESAYGWMAVGGEAERIAVQHDGIPWVVTGASRVYRLRGQNWQQMPGDLDDIAAGPEGAVFGIAPRGAIYRWNDDAFEWANVGGEARRITVDNTGTPWVSTSDRQIYRLRGQTWQNMPGRARDIGAGADGKVWAIGDNEQIFLWNEDSFTWQNMGGDNGRGIAAGPDGAVWVVTSDDRIYRTQGPVDDGMMTDMPDADMNDAVDRSEDDMMGTVDPDTLDTSTGNGDNGNGDNGNN